MGMFDPKLPTACRLVAAVKQKVNNARAKSLPVSVNQLTD